MLHSLDVILFRLKEISRTDPWPCFRSGYVFLGLLLDFVSVNYSIWSSIFALSFKLLMIFSFNIARQPN